MTRGKDVLDARSAADAWASARGLPPSGGYSADWYVDGYLGGWWPDDWSKWWAAYSAAPGSILGGLIVGHQYTSHPVDTSIFLGSEIVTAEPPPATDPTPADFRQALSYLRHDVMDGIRSYKYARIKAAIAEVERVAEQYGAE